MALACTAARKRVYAKASFDVRDSTGQSVCSHSAPLDRSRTVRFSLSLATSRLLERTFYSLRAPQKAVNNRSSVQKRLRLALIVHALSE